MSQAVLFTGLLLFARSAQPLLAESVSRGTPARGTLEEGVSMPSEGRGFVTYSTLGNWLGRQYVHSRVQELLVSAFSTLQTANTERLFVLGETGWKHGGRFRPHRTHQNGLSVDIFMPVRDSNLRSVLMPTAPWNQFGYSLEFDSSGNGEELSIDFRSVAELRVELGRQGQRHGLDIERIITAPEYVDRILAVKEAPDITRLASRFMRHSAWVRHDEHLHVDFKMVRSGDLP